MTVRNPLWNWQGLSPDSGPNQPFFQFCDALEVKNGVSATAQGWGLDHALAAWGRYYAVVTATGGKSQEELGRLAGQVLVSALAVPVGSQTQDAEDGKVKNPRLTVLLGLTKAPTRKALLEDAVSVFLGVPIISFLTPV